MVRRSAFTGSLIVHGAIALGVVGLAMRGHADRPGARSTEVVIELVTALAPPAPPRVDPAGGAALALSPPPVAHAAGRPAAPAPAPPAATRHARTIVPRAAALASRGAEPPRRIEPTSQETSATGAAEDPGSGDGDAAGGGAGSHGNGIGFGAGGGVDTPVGAAPLPVPTPDLTPAPSRAQPPRLIYPARDREIDDSQLFIARLTIDSEGFVVGARLVRGVGGSRDDQAASAVWRFRYRPALDDDGRPVQATIDQRFGVQ